MMRRAASASSALTEMRTSLKALTVSGNTECGTSEAVTDGTPCASSSPRTTLASMSEWARKMTTRRVTGSDAGVAEHRAGRSRHGELAFEADRSPRGELVDLE